MNVSSWVSVAGLNNGFASSSLFSVHVLLAHSVSNGSAMIINMPMSSEVEAVFRTCAPCFLISYVWNFFNTNSVGSCPDTGDLLTWGENVNPVSTLLCEGLCQIFVPSGCLISCFFSSWFASASFTKIWNGVFAGNYFWCVHFLVCWSCWFFDLCWR